MLLTSDAVILLFLNKKGPWCSHDPKKQKDRGFWFTHGLFKALCCSG